MIIDMALNYFTFYIIIIKMNSLTLDFSKDRQLDIPFPQWVSENQTLLEEAKADAKNPKLSEAERRYALAAIEVLKQTPLVPVQ